MQSYTVRAVSHQGEQPDTIYEGTFDAKSGDDAYQQAYALAPDVLGAGETARDLLVTVHVEPTLRDELQDDGSPTWPQYPDGFPPITRHPDYDVNGGNGRAWTVAQGTPRHLATGQLAAARAAIKRQIRLLDRRGIDPGALRSNLTGALAALDGCNFGDFRPGFSVDVVSESEWREKHDDYKGGSPKQGTARIMRYDEKAGTVLARCLVVPDREMPQR